MPMLEKKQIIGAIALISLVFTSVSAEYYSKEYKEVDNSYKEMKLDNELKFEAKRDWAKVEMEWESYQWDDFMYYKIMRSESHSNPVYPEQPAIKYMDNQENDNYEINNYSDQNAIYRICVITKEKNRYCSNTVKLEWFEKEEYKKYEYKKDEYKKDYKEKKDILDYKLKKRADILVENFSKKVEKKYDNNDDRKEAIENVINKLDKLAEKNKKYKTLVDYLNMKLKSKVEKYDDSFEEIEEIFEWL